MKEGQQEVITAHDEDHQQIILYQRSKPLVLPGIKDNMFIQ